MQLETYYTASRIDAIQNPARLERVRQTRDASPADSHRPHVVAQVSMLLSQGRALLHRAPGTVPAMVTTAEESSLESAIAPAG